MERFSGNGTLSILFKVLYRIAKYQINFGRLLKAFMMNLLKILNLISSIISIGFLVMEVNRLTICVLQITSNINMSTF